MDKRFLKLKVIWKDDDMFELHISASNGRYCGQTEVYDSKHSLLPFAKNLKGFPFGKDKLSHQCGEKDSHSYFEMRFYKIGFSGKVGVQINMEENVATEYRTEEKDKLSMELIVEPNTIDIFQRELIALAKNEDGEAELIGIGKYTSNIG